MARTCSCVPPPSHPDLHCALPYTDGEPPRTVPATPQRVRLLMHPAGAAQHPFNAQAAEADAQEAAALEQQVRRQAAPLKTLAAHLLPAPDRGLRLAAMPQPMPQPQRAAAPAEARALEAGAAAQGVAAVPQPAAVTQWDLLPQGGHCAHSRDQPQLQSAFASGAAAAGTATFLAGCSPGGDPWALPRLLAFDATPVGLDPHRGDPMSFCRAPDGPSVWPAPATQDSAASPRPAFGACAPQQPQPQLLCMMQTASSTWPKAEPPYAAHAGRCLGPPAGADAAAVQHWGLAGCLSNTSDALMPMVASPMGIGEAELLVHFPWSIAAPAPPGHATPMAVAGPAAKAEGGAAAVKPEPADGSVGDLARTAALASSIADQVQMGGRRWGNHSWDRGSDVGQAQAQAQAQPAPHGQRAP